MIHWWGKKLWVSNGDLSRKPHYGTYPNPFVPSHYPPPINEPCLYYSKLVHGLQEPPVENSKMKGRGVKPPVGVFEIVFFKMFSIYSIGKLLCKTRAFLACFVCGFCTTRAFVKVLCRWLLGLRFMFLPLF